MMYGLAKDFSSDFHGKGTDCNNKFNDPFNNLEESENINAWVFNYIWQISKYWESEEAYLQKRSFNLGCQSFEVYVNIY